jgi:DNA-binding NarL/FixJ family response regulator
VLLQQSSEIHVIGESGDGHDALAQIELLRPDIAVIDCQLPGLEGIEVAVEIKQRGIPTRVLALSSFAEERYVRGMLDADAVGYLLKEEAPERIIEAVRAAARDEPRFSAKISKMIANWTHGKRPYDLSERDILILRYLVSGKANKAIAAQEGFSEKTVEKYLGGTLQENRSRNARGCGSQGSARRVGLSVEARREIPTQNREIPT